MTDVTPAPSLWTPCPTTVNKALMGAFGFEMLDLALLGLLLFGGFLLRPVLALLAGVTMPPWIPLGAAILAAAGLWYGKRGKPRGAILHWLHEWDVLPLPGVLPPVEQMYHPFS